MPREPTVPRQHPMCLWCDAPAVAWCDAVIGFKAVAAMRDAHGAVIGLVTGSDEKGEAVAWTCDAPMCATHAKRVGHVCGTDTDTIDRCLYHAAFGAEPMEHLVMFEREAVQKRRDIHAEIRRQRILKDARAEKILEAKGLAGH